MFRVSDLEELGDQQAKVIGVAAGDRVVAPPADFTDQLPQTAALKLQVNTGDNTTRHVTVHSSLSSHFFLTLYGQNNQLITYEIIA